MDGMLTNLQEAIMLARKPPKLNANALMLARTFGLNKAAKAFPVDVLTAAQSAANARNSMPKIDATACEPWPPMRAGKVP